MQHETSLIPKPARAPKAAAIAGIVFSVLHILSLVLILISIPIDLRDDETWLFRSGNTILLALNVVPFSGIAFLWFMGVVRDRLGEREDRFFSTVFLGSGLLFLAMLFSFAAMAGSIILVLTTQANRLLVTSGYYYFGRVFVHQILNLYMLKMAGVFMISTSTLFIRTRRIPRWMGWLGYGLAAFLLLRSHYLDRLGWISLTFPLWVLLISIYFLIDNYRQQSQNEST